MTSPSLPIEPERNAAAYHYSSAAPAHTGAYLLPTVLNLITDNGGGNSTDYRPRRVFDLGCGNGATAAALAKHGYEVTGVDPSEQGIRIARQAHPGPRFEQGSCYDDLAAKYGRFPAVVSLEVVEHVFLPRKFAACLFDLLEPGGVAVVSTPYHGYWKNLALALSGKMDAHFTALWDYGHIKFWSIRTLTALFEEAGLKMDRVIRVGRVPPLAKSMIAVARKPTD